MLYIKYNDILLILLDNFHYIKDTNCLTFTKIMKIQL